MCYQLNLSRASFTYLFLDFTLTHPSIHSVVHSLFLSFIHIRTDLFTHSFPRSDHLKIGAALPTLEYLVNETEKVPKTVAHEAIEFIRKMFTTDEARVPLKVIIWPFFDSKK